MEIIKKYKRFIKESVDTIKDVRSLSDVPEEIFFFAKKIVLDVFDQIRKPKFELTHQGIIFKFQVTEQDFPYIDENHPLTIESGMYKKRQFDVILTYLNKITETFEVIYKVDFEPVEDAENDIQDNDDDEIIDEYEKPDPDDLEFFDEDEADRNIKKGRIKLEDDITDLDYDDTNEDFNPFKKEDWKEKGADVRKALGFLTLEEEREKGEKLVKKSKKFSLIYKSWMEKDPEAAEDFLYFIANNPNVTYCNYVDGKWWDTGEYNTGERKYKPSR